MGERIKFLTRSLTIVLAFVCSVLPLRAQDTAVRATAIVAPPYVLQGGDALTGFSIDLWNAISQRLNLQTTYDVKTEFSEVYEAVRLGQADVAVVPVNYSVELDQKYDFSYPVIEAGLQVMVRGKNAAEAQTPLRDVLSLLLSKSALMWLAVGVTILLVPSHILWFLDRGKEDGISPSIGYFPGIFQAMSWSATALVSQVQLLPGRWYARVLGLCWMFGGVVFISLYTAQLSATLTTQKILGSINGPDDLTASLLDREVDAILANGPALRYFAQHEGSGLARVVGEEIRRQDGGFIFRLGSPLRKAVGSAILELREDGIYQEIYQKWFGGF